MSTESAIPLTPPIEEPEFYVESLKRAYDLTIATSGLAERRLDTIEKRLQDVLLLGVTVSVAIVTVASKAQVHYHAWQFKLAVVFFGISILLGIGGRLSGYIKMIHPSELYERFLCIDEPEFMRRVIYWGGEVYTANIALIEKKAWLAMMTFLCLCAALTLLAWWVVAAA